MPTWIRCSARLLTLTVTCALGARAAAAQNRAQVTSPDGRNRVTVEVRDGALTYSVDRDGRAVFLPSRLGFAFQGAPPLRDSLRVVDTSHATVDETWTQPWGEVARVRDHHNELRITVAEVASPGRRFVVAFRAFNDGIGFRYELPAQPGLGEFAITDELTEFTLADDARAWWIPSNRPRLDRSEMLFSSSPVSVLDSVQTPLTMETRDGRTFIVIHEANLVDYARMFLSGPRMQSRTLRAALAPYADGIKVRGRTPFVTPWRTIQLADRATDLAPSLLGLNLNPPNVIQNTSWIKPMKYVGIWWGMHIGTMTWSSGPKHGATTANTKRYIDFAAANGLGGVLVEGWNVGWDGDWIQNRNAFSFTKPYPDYDLAEVARYAHEKGERRSYTNMMSREGARGQEYNAWSAEGGNPPEHETILFFTRMLDGPMDFTPGIFDILIERGTGRPRRPDEPRPRTTLAKQLALYVVLYSPLQMAADLPENYEHQPAFQFIRDVAIDWDTTRVLAGKIGDYVVVARRERNGSSWYIGAVTDEEGRTFDIPLTFLTPGRKYVAEIYADGPGANWLTNPLPVAISQRPVDAKSRLHLVLAPGGGQAIRIGPAR